MLYATQKKYLSPLIHKSYEGSDPNLTRTYWIEFLFTAYFYGAITQQDLWDLLYENLLHFMLVTRGRKVRNPNEGQEPPNEYVPEHERRSYHYGQLWEQMLRDLAGQPKEWALSRWLGIIDALEYFGQAPKGDLPYFHSRIGCFTSGVQILYNQRAGAWVPPSPDLRLLFSGD